jgi:hypothetical protein
MMRHMNLQRVAASAAILVLAGCPGRLDDAEKQQFLNFDAGSDAGPACNAETDILIPTCGAVPCHDPNTHQNNLDLKSAGVAGRISTQTSQCNGMSELALIPKKITSSPPCGLQMPSNGTTLTTAQAHCLDAYIAALAADAGVDAGL